MKSVFSHIVQKRLSQENENVATDALTFIISRSQVARTALMKLLRGVAPELPSLRFRPQQTQADARPDMWGYDGIYPRVLIENKFWAGLTDNQPVGYLRLLAGFKQPSILLVIVPEEREEIVWRELRRRLKENGTAAADSTIPSGLARLATTAAGPFLALTSWTKVLATLEADLADEPQTMSDLQQLRALCDAADRGAFVPFAADSLTDQRTGAFMLQLNSIVQGAVDLGVTEGVLSIDGLRPACSWGYIGRYVWLGRDGKAGAWLGVYFDLWRNQGRTPIWLCFSDSSFGRATEVEILLQDWIEERGSVFSRDAGQFSVGIDLATGEEKERTVRLVVDQLAEIVKQVSGLEPRPVPVQLPDAEEI